MAILIFNRSNNMFFDRWLQDVNEEIVLFNQANLSRVELSNYSHVENFKSLDNYKLVEQKTFELLGQFEFTKVIAHSEYDLISAAYLREKLNIDGQSVKSAISYRDKIVMKECLDRENIDIAPFKEIKTKLDVIEFMNIHGLPLVIKPKDGGGSRGTHVIADIEAFEEFLNNKLDDNLMIEKFIEGEMYHIDGIAKNGKILCSITSRYLNGCLAFQRGIGLGSVLTNQKDEISKRLKELLLSVISSLPETPILAFHAEVFHTKEDRLIVCEIASRTAGSRVIDNIRNIYGLDLNRLWVRLQCGIDEKVNLPEGKVELGGFITIPPQNGKLIGLPQNIPFDKVIDYSVSAKPGNIFREAASSVDNIASIMIKGESEDSIESKLNEISDWYIKNMEWE